MPSFPVRFVAALLLTAALPAGAGAAASAGEWRTSVSPALVSGYVFRGQPRGGAAVQAVIESARDGFGAGLWTSFPLEASGPFAPGTEVDLYVFRSLPVGGGLALVPGATLYTYPRADRAAGFRRATLEPSLALDVTVAGVRFTPKVYHDLTLRGTTLELTGVFALALPSLGTELDFSAVAGTYDRQDDLFAGPATAKAWGDYWQAGVSLPYQISASTRVIAGWTYGAGTAAAVKVGGAGRIADPRVGSRGFVSVGFSTVF